MHDDGDCKKCRRLNPVSIEADVLKFSIKVNEILSY